jgi:hypothetical protein
MLIVVCVALAACHDAKLDRAKAEVGSLAAVVTRNTGGEEGSMTCPKLEDLAPDAGVPKNDPWGRPYVLACENGLQVVSAGPDGVFDSSDDIRSTGRRNPFPP